MSSSVESTCSTGNKCATVARQPRKIAASESACSRRFGLGLSGSVAQSETVRLYHEEEIRAIPALVFCSSSYFSFISFIHFIDQTPTPSSTSIFFFSPYYYYIHDKRASDKFIVRKFYYIFILLKYTWRMKIRKFIWKNKQKFYLFFIKNLVEKRLAWQCGVLRNRSWVRITLYKIDWNL